MSSLPLPTLITARRRRVVVGYVAAAGGWILLTDALSFTFGAGSATEQTAKGGAFVVVTATVLALLLRRHDRELHDEQQARHQWERQLALIAESTQDVIYRIERDPRRFTFISSSVTLLLGVTPEEILSDPTVADGFVHPQDRGRRAATGDAELLRLRWRHRDGRTVWIEQRNRIENRAGQRAALVGVARDITEEILTTSVHEACSRFDQLVLEGGSADEGLRAVAGAVRAVTEASRLRVSIEPVSGLAIDLEVAVDEPDAEVDPLVVIRGRARIELVPSPHTPSGAFVRALLDEMLVRVESSVDHERRRRELERVEVALHATGIAIALTDDRGRITWTNDAFGRLTGLSEPDVTGQSIESLLTDPGSDLGAGLSARITSGTRLDTELEVARADGSSFLAALSAAPVRYADGGLEGAVASFRDLTDERRATAELHAAQLSVVRRQRDLERERTALVQTLSHELRTPLTVVLGAAQTLQNDRLPRDVRDRLVCSLGRGTDDLVRHLDAVLAVTEGRAGEVLATTGRAVVGMAMERLASRYDLARVRIEGEAPWTGLATEAAGLLRPLIHNALKFSAADAPVEVTIGVGSARGLHAVDGRAGAGTTMVVIEILDHGPGIPETMVPLLDLPFRQADSSITRPHGGLGLGLHAARRAADRLGARLVTSTSPTGTRVRVELPMGPVAVDQRVGSSASASSRM